MVEMKEDERYSWLNEVYSHAVQAALKRGLEILSGCGQQSDVKQKRAEAAGLPASKKHEAAKSLASR